MRPTAILAIVALLAALVVVLLAALSRHKKAGSGDIKLIGEIGMVESRLAPEGTVIVGGELWLAKSNDGAAIAANVRVRVVGFEDHLALVAVCD